LRLNDGARLAREAYRGCPPLGIILRQSAGGAHLLALGYDDDIRAAACWDAFALVPEARQGPAGLEIRDMGRLPRPR